MKISNSLISQTMKKIINYNIFGLKINRKQNAQLLQYQKKTYMLWGDMNQNKRSKESPIPISDREYYNIMNEFIEEAEGTPYASQKYYDLRNKYYKKVTELHRKNIAANKKIVQSGGDEYFLRFYIMLYPESIDCFKLLSILNYNLIMYRAFEDDVYTKKVTQNFLGYEYRKVFKSVQLPFLQMECSEHSPVKIETYSEIINFLVENKLITDFRTFSAYESEGLKVCKELEDLFKHLFLKPNNKFTFYIKHVNFEECFYAYDARNNSAVYIYRLFNKMYRCLRFIAKDLVPYYKNHFRNKKTKKDYIKDFSEIFKKWSLRLNKKPFHGGDFPDDADFTMFCLIQKYRQSTQIDVYFKYASNPELVFRDWFDKMHLLTTRSAFFDRKDFAYTYNPNLSKEIMDEIENEFVTKRKKKKYQTDFSSAFASDKRRVVNI